MYSLQKYILSKNVCLFFLKRYKRLTVRFVVRSAVRHPLSEVSWLASGGYEASDGQ